MGRDFSFCLRPRRQTLALRLTRRPLTPLPPRRDHFFFEPASGAQATVLSGGLLLITCRYAPAQSPQARPTTRWLSTAQVQVMRTASSRPTGGTSATVAVVLLTPRSWSTLPGQGDFRFELTVEDQLGLPETLLQIVTLTSDGDQAPRVAQAAPVTCGCNRLIVETQGMSVLHDFRRRPPNGAAPQAPLPPAPLGEDPDYITYNFQVRADLMANGNSETTRDRAAVRSESDCGQQGDRPRGGNWRRAKGRRAG